MIFNHMIRLQISNSSTAVYCLHASQQSRTATRFCCGSRPSPGTSTCCSGETAASWRRASLWNRGRVRALAASPRPRQRHSLSSAHAPTPGPVRALATSLRPSRQQLNCQLLFHRQGNGGFERFNVIYFYLFILISTCIAC